MFPVTFMLSRCGGTASNMPILCPNQFAESGLGQNHLGQ
jgi:hypothetical protein